MLKITVDENIENAEEVFSELADVTLLSGREINKNIMKNSDVLVVRSITKVDKNLLDGTNVKFVGTATIGSDHIDVEYLKQNNIAFADAKGCNAEAVKEYVLTALTEVLIQKKLKYQNLSIGIVGVGNIGSKIAKCAKELGMKTILNDPPLKRKTGNEIYKEFDEVLNADILTFHVPLNKEGVDKTVHLFDYEKLNRVKNNSIIINSSRGSVIDNEALEKVIDEKNLIVILDVWESEPEINSSLLQKVFIGTPHVAGYSYEGKINGTMMIYSALCRFLNKEATYSIKPLEVDDPVIELDKAESIENSLQKIFKKIYDIRRDDKNLRKILKEEKDKPGKYFDLLRKKYPLRREFSNYSVLISKEEKELINILSALRFKIDFR
ncbi:MAG TPA: 4-phosphoerythronate dehydrogenase [Ignavibacteriaceae bacterium]|nr:4-phosphoerythronate dehydrogenase [Ignavibacteriaceae bacterium]